MAKESGADRALVASDQAASRLAPLGFDHGEGDTLLTAAVQEIGRLTKALQAIVDWKPAPYDFPADWHEQIRACEDCQRYNGHPIQQGICDTHRRPLWAREAHDKHQEGPARGAFMWLTAHDALSECPRAAITQGEPS